MLLVCLLLFGILIGIAVALGLLLILMQEDIEFRKRKNNNK